MKIGEFKSKVEVLICRSKPNVPKAAVNSSDFPVIYDDLTSFVPSFSNLDSKSLINERLRLLALITSGGLYICCKRTKTLLYF